MANQLNVQCPHALAADQLGGHFNAHALAHVSLHPVDQTIDRQLAEAVLHDFDCRQWRIDDFAIRQVVKADDRDVAGDFQAMFLDGFSSRQRR